MNNTVVAVQETTSEIAQQAKKESVAKAGGGKRGRKKSSKVESSGASFIRTLQHENRILSHLLDDLEVHADQLQRGGAPDYTILYEITHCLHHYPQQFLHSGEDKLWDLLASRRLACVGDVEEIKLEQGELIMESDWLLGELHDFCRQENQVPDSVLHDHLFDFIDYFRGYIRREETLLPTLAELFDEDDWQNIRQEIALPAKTLRPGNSFAQSGTKNASYGTAVSANDHGKTRSNFDKRVRDTLDNILLAEVTGAYLVLEGVGVAQEALDGLREISEQQLSEAWQADKAAIKACEDDFGQATELPLRLAQNHWRSWQDGLKASRVLLGNRVGDFFDVVVERGETLNAIQKVEQKTPPKKI